MRDKRKWYNLRGEDADNVFGRNSCFNDFPGGWRRTMEFDGLSQYGMSFEEYMHACGYYAEDEKPNMAGDPTKINWISLEDAWLKDHSEFVQELWKERIRETS